MGLLKPIVGGRIRAITWKNDHGGLDKLGIIPSARGIQFVKRDDGGKLAGLFVAYTYTPTMFWRPPQVVRMPWVPEARSHPLGVNALRCPGADTRRARSNQSHRLCYAFSNGSQSGVAKRQSTLGALGAVRFPIACVRRCAGALGYLE